MPNVLLSTKAAGDIVTLKVSGSPRNFIVVQQGRPASGNYDISFDDVTWLLMQDIYDQRQWAGSGNDYANSSIHSWLNNASSGFLSLLDADIRAVIPTVKIPYRPGSGTSSSVSSGANGLACKAFLLSMLEVGLSPSYSPSEGATLTYFTSGGNARRIANYNGAPYRWWTRSPDTDNSNYVCNVGAGGIADGYGADDTGGCRPALPLPSNLYVSDDGSILTNEPPTAPGSINATNVVGGQDATITITAATDPDGTVESYVYERSVDDSSHWDVIATTSALSTTDHISSEWGTVAYRAKAVDDDGASGPYVTSEQYDVNVGWVLIGGPSAAMGQQIKPFTLSAAISVSGQTGVTDITVTGYLDGAKVLDTILDQGENAEISVDTRVLASGQHTIQMQAEKGELLPANKAWQFSIPSNTLPDGGRAEQLWDENQVPIFPRTTSQMVFCQGGTLADVLVALQGGSAAPLLEPVVKAAPPSGSYALSPGVLYDFTQADASALTFTFEAPAAGKAAAYHVMFKSGSTAATVTLPDGVKTPDGYVIEANRVYELSILQNMLAYMSWGAD